jgi:hypothetical protein
MSTHYLSNVFVWAVGLYEAERGVAKFCILTWIQLQWLPRTFALHVLYIHYRILHFTWHKAEILC